MEDKLYEKVDNICQRINSYAEKDISVKNKVKTEIYIDKIKKLINMIETAEGNAATPRARARTKIEEVNSENILDDKYNPYGENFCYKERLEKLGGDINKLIEELKDEDKMGYRNAYIIKNIENNINKHNVKVIDVSKNNAVNKTLNNNKMSLWDKIKSIFK